MLTRVINCISDISALEHAEPETAYNNEKTNSSENQIRAVYDCVKNSVMILTETFSCAKAFPRGEGGAAPEQYSYLYGKAL